jgi:hypothetical protein
VQAVSGYLDLPANVPRLIVSVPVAELHNISLTSNGAVYIGGADVQTGTGINMQMQDTLSFSWQDFRPDDKSVISFYGVASADTSVNFLLWRR